MLRTKKVAASVLGTLAVIVSTMIAATPATAAPADNTVSETQVAKKKGAPFVAHDGNTYTVVYEGTFGGGKFAWEIGQRAAGKYAVQIRVLQGGAAKIIIADYPQNGGAVIATECTCMKNDMVAAQRTRVFQVTVRRAGNEWVTNIGLPQ